MSNRPPCPPGVNETEWATYLNQLESCYLAQQPTILNQPVQRKKFSFEGLVFPSIAIGLAAGILLSYAPVSSVFTSVVDKNEYLSQLFGSVTDTAEEAVETINPKANPGEELKTNDQIAGYVVTDDWDGQRSYGNHRAADFARPGGHNASVGQPVYAPFSGTVKPVNNTSCGYGAYYTSTGLPNYKLLFCHFQNGVNVGTANGEVKAGDIIGRIGSSGNSTGAHLHAQLIDPNGNPVPISKDLAFRFLTGRNQ